jgi:nicotinamidase-related amidase
MNTANLCAKRQVGDNRLSKENAALLMIDHQTGLMQIARDYQYDEFKNNVLALAAIGKLYNLPVVLTTSFEKGPNGPLLPELKKEFPNAPFIPRPGQINAWDNEDFVKAVKVTDVCVAFPALAALSEGYDVYIVVDASGTLNKSIREAALSRMIHAGAIPMGWFALSAELQRDWRDNGEGLTKLYKKHLVPYDNLISSHDAK